MNQKDKEEIRRRLKRERIKFFIILCIIGFTSGFVIRFILDYPYEVSMFTKCYYYNESISSYNDTTFNLVVTSKDFRGFLWNEENHTFESNMTISIVEPNVALGGQAFPKGIVIAFNYSEKEWEDVVIQSDKIKVIDCPIKRTTTLTNEIMNYFNQMFVRD